MAVQSQPFSAPQPPRVGVAASPPRSAPHAPRTPLALPANVEVLLWSPDHA